jgi:hypothetical protein
VALALMANKDTTLDKDVLRAAMQARLFSRVAQQLNLDRSHVRRVALGLRKSKRVTSAIKRELARIEKNVTRAAA